MNRGAQCPVWTRALVTPLNGHETRVERWHGFRNGLDRQFDRAVSEGLGQIGALTLNRMVHVSAERIEHDANNRFLIERQGQGDSAVGYPERKVQCAVDGIHDECRRVCELGAMLERLFAEEGAFREGLSEASFGHRFDLLVEFGDYVRCVVLVDSRDDAILGCDHDLSCIRRNVNQYTMDTVETTPGDVVLGEDGIEVEGG